MNVAPRVGDDAPAAVSVVDLRAAEVLDDVVTLDLQRSSPGRSRGSTWHHWYVAALVLLDVGALTGGGVAAMKWKFGTVHEQVAGVSYLVIVLAAALPWVVTLAASGGYEARVFGLGAEEFRRVGNAAARFTALVAVLAFAVNMNIARGLVALALPVTSALTLVLRYLARRVLHGVRVRGAACHRVLVVGEGPSAALLVRRMGNSPHSGLRVVGTWAPRPSAGGEALDGVVAALAAVDADTIAVAHSPSVSAAALRRMAWTIEDSGVDLLVAPALTDVAGPRIHVRPVSGMPLLQVAPPEFSGTRRVVKRTLDVIVTLALLVVLMPLLVFVVAAIRLTSRGPALFQQVRIGRDGAPFTMYKFRSMTPDAELRREDLLPRNESDGVLFKMRNDPRVTGLGRWLRRLSLDELPQLLNVLRGQMSLVGPRPPLPGEVARYEGHVRRRLLVTPGMTGLWQVSGRSDLSWEEAVRLDLYYVENWSVALDAEILWKTVFAVLRGNGAR